jgi:hypothetical protein
MVSGKKCFKLAVSGKIWSPVDVIKTTAIGSMWQGCSRSVGSVSQGFGIFGILSSKGAIGRRWEEVYIHNTYMHTSLWIHSVANRMLTWAGPEPGARPIKGCC